MSSSDEEAMHTGEMEVDSKPLADGMPEQMEDDGLEYGDVVGKEIDVTADGGVKKTILVKGESWELPERSDKVTVHYVGTLDSDGSQFDSSRDRGEPFVFTLGEGQVIKGWDLGVATMKKGEKAILKCTAPYAYGDSGSPPKIPGGATLNFEVELLSWQSVKDIAGDGGVIKTVVTEGTGYTQPADRDEVTVKYAIKIAGAAAPFATSPEEGSEFTVSQGLLGVRAFAVTVRTMKKGEKAVLKVKPEYGYGADGKAPDVPPNAELEVEVEVVSWKKVEDVTDDGAVVKKVLEESSEWKRPNEGARVTLRGRGLLADGTTVFDEWSEGGELVFTTDEEQVCEGLDLGVMKMKKGERALISIPPGYGFGEAGHTGRLAAVPPNSAVSYELELVEFENAKESWEMSDAEKVAAASTKKDKGNKAWKEGKVGRAIRLWDKAVGAVAYDKSYPDDVKATAKEVKKSCWLNLAAAHLKQSNWGEVIKQCNKVLEQDSHNTKALYRRAQALAAQGDLFEAECDVKKGLVAEPANADLRALATKLRAQSKDQVKKEAALYSKMFKFPASTTGHGKGAGEQAHVEKPPAPATADVSPMVEAA